MAPRTSGGRLMTILYAIIGIPLTFLYLSNIGNFFASCFRLLYKNFCCDILCCQRCERQKKMRREQLRHLRKLQDLAMNALKSRALRNNYSKSPTLATVTTSPTSDNTIIDSSIPCYKENGKLLTVCEKNAILTNSSNSVVGRQHTEVKVSVDHVDDVERLSLGLLDIPETDILSESTENLLSFESLNDLRDETKFMSIINMAKETDIISESPSSISPNSSPSENKRHVAYQLCDALSLSQCDVTTLTEESESTVAQEISPKKSSTADINNPKSDVVRWHSTTINTAEQDVNITSSIEGASCSTPDKKRKKENKKIARSKSDKVKTKSKSPNRFLLPRSKSHNATEDASSNSRYDIEVDTTDIEADRSDVESIPTSKKLKNSSSLDYKSVKNKSHNKELFRSPSRNEKNSRFHKKYTKHKQNSSPYATYSSIERDDKKQSLEKIEKMLEIEKIFQSLPNSSSTPRVGRSLERSKTVKDSGSTHRVVFGKRKSISMTLEDVRNVNQALTRSKSSESLGLNMRSNSASFKNDAFEHNDDLHVKLKDFQSIAIDNEIDIEPMLADYAEILSHPSALLATTDPFDYEQNAAEESGPISVPISVCVLVMAAYIVGGAILFSQWENWNFLEGCYFCFITLATIGLGDLVPGMEKEKWESNEKLVVSALWLAFGLSLIAMCFNLMQEEVKEKFRWLGYKVGLIKTEGQ